MIAILRRAPAGEGVAQELQHLRGLDGRGIGIRRLRRELRRALEVSLAHAEVG